MEPPEQVAGAPPSRARLLGSVRTAARVLRAFSEADTELGVTELARRLGLSKSTAHRVLATLAAERLLEQDQETGRYRLGLALYELGSAVSEHVDLHRRRCPCSRRCGTAPARWSTSPSSTGSRSSTSSGSRATTCCRCSGASGTGSPRT